MHSEIKIYKMNDFIRINRSGEIDYNKTIEIIRQIYSSTTNHPNHNVLIDMRGTTPEETYMKSLGMATVLDVTMQFVRIIPSFKEKIACIIPEDEKRVSIAEKFEACMTIKNYRYKFFTGFESAIEWLSEV